MYCSINDPGFFKACLGSIQNQLLLTLPGIYVFFKVYPIEESNILYSLLSLPIIVIGNDIYFYLTHRLLHSRLLWKYHKKHHNEKVNVAKALDASPIEHTLSNMGSFIFVILLLQYFGFTVNIYVIYLWGLIATINTCYGHSPIYDKDGVHLKHHKHLNCNYGSGFYLLDRLCGTYRV